MYVMMRGWALRLTSSKWAESTKGYLMDYLNSFHHEPSLGEVGLPVWSSLVHPSTALGPGLRSACGAECTRCSTWSGIMRIAREKRAQFRLTSP